MGDKSAISWTDASWNPVIGCTHVSRGCDACYARELHNQRYLAWKRGRMPTAPVQYHQPFKVVQLKPERLSLPLRWRKPRRIFVNSMSDLFHEDVPDEFIAAVFTVAALAPRHTFQILTKRPERMRRWFERVAAEDGWWWLGRAASEWLDVPDLARRGLIVSSYEGAPAEEIHFDPGEPWPLPNVWLGVSVEDQERADQRIPILIDTPAAVRFLSCEPLLDELSLAEWLDISAQCWPCTADLTPDLSGRTDGGWSLKPDPITGIRSWRPALDWIICGGESGPRRRPMELDWARRLRDQCDESGVAFWFKQESALRPGQGETLDGRTWHEFPRTAA